MEAGLQTQAFLEAGDEQMLFDPFEEQFDLPTAANSLAMVKAGTEKLLVRKLLV